VAFARHPLARGRHGPGCGRFVAHCSVRTESGSLRSGDDQRRRDIFHISRPSSLRSVRDGSFPTLAVCEQRFSGVSAPNSRRCRGAAVAATNDAIGRSICNRRVTATSVSSTREGGRCVELRAATSVWRAGVKRSCAAFGLPRAVGECEGAECSTTARGGDASCWSRLATRKRVSCEGEARAYHSSSDRPKDYKNAERCGHGRPNVVKYTVSAAGRRRRGSR